MGKLFGSGSGGSQTTETNPWGPAQDTLKKILENANNLFDAQGGINAEWIDKELADLSPEMQTAMKDLINSEGMKETIGNIQQATQQGMSGIGQATGMLGGLAQQGVTSENINKMASELYDSDLVKSQKGQLGKEIDAGLKKNVQGINQAASGSGNMGSSRAGVAEGVAIGEASDAYATGTAGIENSARNQAYTQALGTLQGNQSTALGASGQLGSLGLGSANAQLGTLTGQQNILQNQLQGAGIGQQWLQNQADNNWFNAQGQQNMGWDMIGKLMGVGTGIGGMGGTSTSTNTGSTTGQLGQLVGMGASIAGMFSDASMKKKIKKKGKTKTGEDKYEWEWNKSAKKIAGLEGKSEGVLAQAVDKKKGAVGKDKKSGKLFVDYDKV